MRFHLGLIKPWTVRIAAGLIFMLLMLGLTIVCGYMIGTDEP